MESETVFDSSPSKGFIEDLQGIDQFKKLVHQLVLRDLLDDLALLEQKALPHSA